jgi:putative PIN family toxin of toxin-antitoxin system
VHDHRYQLFVSEPILTEILGVLRRPELKEKFHTLEKLNIASIMEILGQASVVEIQVVTGVSRDPKDDKFLATAVAAKADYLVSEDKDLLVLKEYRGVKIIDAKTFLELV